MNQGEVQQHYTRQKCAKKTRKRVWGPRCAKATTTSNTTIQRFLSTHGAPAFNSSEALKRPLRLPDPSAAASQTGTSQQKSQNLPRTTQIRRLQNKPQPCAAQERLQPEKVHKRSSRSPEPRTLAKPEAPSNPETLSKGCASIAKSMPASSRGPRAEARRTAVAPRAFGKGSFKLRQLWQLR